MASVQEIIERRHGEIVDQWRRSAEEAAFARGLTAPELANLMSPYLSTLCAERAADRPHLSEAQIKLIERHVSGRLRQGFVLNEILTEFAILGRTVSQVLDAEPAASRPSVAEVARLFAELSQTTIVVSNLFSEHLLEDEQTEKRYTRLIQGIASETQGVEGHPRPLRSRLNEVLSLVMDAMATQAASLVLVDANTGRPVLAASLGEAAESLGDLSSREEATTLAGKITSFGGGVISIPDVDATELGVSDAFRASGIKSLVGVHISARAGLRGILWVGRREKHDFTASDVRRIEGLAETIGIHIANAQLTAALKARVEECKAEAALRERFIGLLMHDLSAPLTAAKVNAKRLLEATRGDLADCAGAVVGSLARLEAMISDLLDAHRIRAGMRLPMTFTECDLGSLTLETVEELRGSHGDRFVLRAEPRVKGVWSGEQLRRTIWNLATNAIHHGAAGGAVVLTVRRVSEGAEFTVHNDGPPISTERQVQLFKPFAMPLGQPADHPPGWGLGLTLVWGCVEAHGARVSVESRMGTGTTVRVLLPLDARAYADASSS